jgi:hypothetical protein
MRMDGRTDVTELIAAFRNFANSHKYVIQIALPSLRDATCDRRGLSTANYKLQQNSYTRLNLQIF